MLFCFLTIKVFLFAVSILNLVPQAGLEPATHEFSIRCSTIGAIVALNCSGVTYGGRTRTNRITIWGATATLRSHLSSLKYMVSDARIELALLGPKPRVIPFHQSEIELNLLQ